MTRFMLIALLLFLPTLAFADLAPDPPPKPPADSEVKKKPDPPPTDEQPPAPKTPEEGVASPPAEPEPSKAPIIVLVVIGVLTLGAAAVLARKPVEDPPLPDEPAGDAA